jgi:hypothetical protein
MKRIEHTFQGPENHALALVSNIRTVVHSGVMLHNEIILLHVRLAFARYSRCSFLLQHLEIHWFSIINSCVAVLLLTGTISRRERSSSFWQCCRNTAYESTFLPYMRLFWLYIRLRYGVFFAVQPYFGNPGLWCVWSLLRGRYSSGQKLRSNLLHTSIFVATFLLFTPDISTWSCGNRTCCHF